MGRVPCRRSISREMWPFIVCKLMVVGERGCVKFRESRALKYVWVKGAKFGCKVIGGIAMSILSPDIL